ALSPRCRTGCAFGEADKSLNSARADFDRFDRSVASRGRAMVTVTARRPPLVTQAHARRPVDGSSRGPSTRSMAIPTAVETAVFDRRVQGFGMARGPPP